MKITENDRIKNEEKKLYMINNKEDFLEIKHSKHVEAIHNLCKEMFFNANSILESLHKKNITMIGVENSSNLELFSTLCKDEAYLHNFKSIYLSNILKLEEKYLISRENFHIFDLEEPCIHLMSMTVMIIENLIYELSKSLIDKRTKAEKEKQAKYVNDNFFILTILSDAEGACETAINACKESEPERIDHWEKAAKHIQSKIKEYKKVAAYKNNMNIKKPSETTFNAVDTEIAVSV